MKTRQKRIVAAGVVVLVGVGVAGWWVLPWLKSVMPSGAERLHSAENMPGVVQRYKIKDPLKGVPTTRPGERIQLTPAELARWRAPLNWNAPGHMPAKPDWSDPITRMSVSYMALPIDPESKIGRELGPELCAWLKNWCQQASEGKLGDGYLMEYWEQTGQYEKLFATSEHPIPNKHVIPKEKELMRLLNNSNASVETLWLVGRSVSCISNMHQAKPWYEAAIRRAEKEIVTADDTRTRALCDMVAYMMRPVFQQSKFIDLSRRGFTLIIEYTPANRGKGLYLRRAKFLHAETWYEACKTRVKKDKICCQYGIEAARRFENIRKEVKKEHVPKAEWLEYDWLIGASLYMAHEDEKSLPYLMIASRASGQYYQKSAKRYCDDIQRAKTIFMKGE